MHNTAPRLHATPIRTSTLKRSVRNLYDSLANALSPSLKESPVPAYVRAPRLRRRSPSPE